MRRPLKPFVTEYRGSNRRGSTVIEAPETDRPKPFDSGLRSDPEDSYEAAMRAADALFASPSPKPGNEAPPPRSDRSSDASSPAPTGRILRAIDEPPPQQFAALEAEHAPKRRGRKPGSKNKPKPQIAGAEETAAAAVPGPKRRGRPPGKRNAVPAPQAIPAIATLAALPNATQAAASPTKSNGWTGAVTRDEKRFSWARGRLKPGEAWKRRRLPRVCW